MNRAGRNIVAFVLLLGMVTGLSACEFHVGSDDFTPNHGNVLTVMTQPMPTPGFWEGTQDHPTGGFSYELCKDLASKLGVDKVRIETEDFSDIVAGHLKDADIAMSLITPTDERENVLDFTTPYLESPPALLTRVGTDVPDVHTAQGLQFAVGKNTTFVDMVSEQIRPDAPAIEYENRDREIQAVKSGRADVAVFDLPAALAIVNDNPDLTVTARLDSTEPIAVALPKNSSNTEAVGQALRSLDSDGTIDDLANQYLGESVTDSANNVPLLRTDQ